MKELNQIFEQAIMIFFNAASNQSEASGIGIAFGNSEHPTEAYQLIKSNFLKKLIITLTIRPVVLDIMVNETGSNKEVFKATLNYDEVELVEYQKKCPPGNSGFLVIGAFHDCRFYIINPEEEQKDFQPFQVETYMINKE